MLPLTPGPSPLPGARGASCDLQWDKTRRMLPSPRAGCSGLLGRRGVCVNEGGTEGGEERSLRVCFAVTPEIVPVRLCSQS